MFRYYQDDAINNTEFSWCEHNRTCGSIGTGGGKTVVAAGVIARSTAEGLRTAFLADQNELCEQPLKAIRRFAGIIPSLDKGRSVGSLESECVVASSQTWLNKERLNRYPINHFHRIIIDECHRGTERDLGFIDVRFPDAQVLGLTATPYRKNLRDLTKWFPDVPFKKSMKELSLEGFAPPVRGVPLAVEIDLTQVGTSTIGGETDYKLGDLDTTIAPYYHAIAKGILEFARTRHIICFLPLVKSSIEFVAILRSYGISARHIDGKSKDREEIIESFSRGEFHILCNSDVLSTGVDIPIADTLLDLSPTSSPTKYFQRVGRVMRVLPGVIDDLPREDQAEERLARIKASAKPEVIVIEAIFQGDRLNSFHAGHIVSDDEATAKAIYERLKKERSPEDLLEIARRVQAEKEERLVEAIEEATARAHAYEPEQVGLLLASPKILDYDAVSGWEIAPPSRAQFDLLARLGISPETVKFKGLANKIIDEVMSRKRLGYASLEQVAALRKAGVPHPERLSRREAASIISSKGKAVSK